MPILLVVDDSEVDRRLMGGLLSKDLDWIIEFAENGNDALERMKTIAPDLVVTDLMMPEMDGMELVANIRLENPDVPVILVTGHGSETLAVEALDHGAASYVPKEQLGDKLLETVEQVLSLAKADRSYGRLVDCLDKTEYRFTLDNDPALIPPLVDLIQQMLSGMGVVHGSDRVHVAVALEEALLNALLHGNLEIPKPQVQDVRTHLRRGQFPPEVETRREAEPYAERRIRVHAEITRDRAGFTIQDDGNGFDTSKVPAPHDPETLNRDEHRGLVLMRNFMDDVTFNKQGNEVTMIFARRS